MIGFTNSIAMSVMSVKRYVGLVGLLVVNSHKAMISMSDTKMFLAFKNVTLSACPGVQ